MRRFVAETRQTFYSVRGDADSSESASNRRCSVRCIGRLSSMIRTVSIGWTLVQRVYFVGPPTQKQLNVKVLPSTGGYRSRLRWRSDTDEFLRNSSWCLDRRPLRRMLYSLGERLRTGSGGTLASYPPFASASASAAAEKEGGSARAEDSGGILEAE